MVEHIDGSLYYETMGKSGPVMAFVHPNPMDQSCWIFQTAATLHLVSLHRYRSAGLREVAEGTRRAHHAGHRTGLLGGDR